MNLTQLAAGFVSTDKLEPNYKRLQRFLGKFKLDYSTLPSGCGSDLEQGFVEFRIWIRESDKRENGRQFLKAKVFLNSIKVGQRQVL